MNNQPNGRVCLMRKLLSWISRGGGVRSRPLPPAARAPGARRRTNPRARPGRYTVMAGLVLLLTALACTESALYVPPATLTPVPSATMTVTPEAGRRFVVTSDALEVRASFGEASQNVGYLKKGAEVRVYETHKTKLEMCREWGRIGDSLWVCVDRLKPLDTPAE